jgi:phosphate transport system substrate-binding protein
MGTRTAAAGLALLGAALHACALAQETVTAGGTGASFGIMRLLGEGFAAAQPGIRVVVAPNLGTSGGYRALAAGRIDIALGSRPPVPAEGKGLQTSEFARSPFVVAVQRSNPAGSIAMGELERYYGDANAAWPDGARVRVVLRPASETDTALLRAFSPNLARAVDQAAKRAGMLLGPSDSDAADLLERTPGALGATTLGLILAERRALKALALDGQSPSIAAMAAGRYRHVKTLYLVTSEGVSPAARKFIAYARSKSGAAILEKHGFLSAGR